MSKLRVERIVNLLVFAFGLLLIADSAAANSEGDKRKNTFDTASIEGVYAVAATGEGGSVGPEALFGLLTFNGKGQFSGQLINNTGARFAERQLSSHQITGLYQVNATGRGALEFIDVPALKNAIFAITKVSKVDGEVVASEISFVTKEVSSMGNTVLGKLVRRSYEGPITAKSMTGDYGFVNKGLGGFAPGIALGDVNWDAQTMIVKGDFTISALAPDGQRVLFDFFSGGPYTPSDKNDGTGTTFSDTTGGSSHYVVTKVTKVRGKLVAEEIFFVPEFLDPIGNFSPALISRISN